jgi:acyl carrier protein
LLEYCRQFEAYIKETRSEPFLGAITIDQVAYTLQNYREEYSIRVALLVDNLDELQASLAQFLDLGVSQSKLENLNIFSTDRQEESKENKKTTNKKITEEEREFSSWLIAKRNLKALAQLWVKGVPVLWSQLFVSKQLSPIYLPTYAFERNLILWSGLGSSDPVAADTPVQRPEPPSQKQQVSVQVVEAKSSTPTLDSDQNLMFLAELFELSENEQIDQLTKHIQIHVANLLGYEGGRLPSLNDGFFDLGIESMQVVKFTNKLEKDFGLKLADTAMFKYPDIGSFSKYILSIINSEEFRNKFNEMSQKLEIQPSEKVLPESESARNQLIAELESLMKEDRT